MRIKKLLVLFFMGIFLSGCASVVKTKTRVDAPTAYRQARTASLDELVELINERYATVGAITVRNFQVEFKGGSVEQGFFESYPKAKGYLIAKEPDAIYVNILNPLTSSTVVAMASRERTFQVWSPRDNKYVTGSTEQEMDEDNPVLNVRPHHLLNAIMVESLPVDDDPNNAYFLEEEQDAEHKYYTISVVASDAGSSRWCLQRKIWIERSSLRMVRQQYYECGRVISIIRYADPINLEGSIVNSSVDLERVPERYQMKLNLGEQGVEINRVVREEAFVIPRPPGSELIEVGKRNEPVRP
jgi:hypothetical protein